MNTLDQFNKEVQITYKDENYLVRDNGAVLRQRKSGSRKRPLDEDWTFGKKNKKKGYMFIGRHEVHRIVAYAFLGHPPSNEYVVDHIDTNKCNNRPENLRWVTRLENIILNPITLKKIEIVYGSLEKFFENPKSDNKNTIPNFEWMRTVSKEEANSAKERLLKWANSDKTFKNGSLGEWIYNTRSEYTTNSFSLKDKNSLTHLALQRNWKWLCEFPSCPDTLSSEPLKKYLMNLKEGSIFTKNEYGETYLKMAKYGKNFIGVITSDKKNIKPWGVVKITFENNRYVHEPMGSFFELNGAKKVYFKLFNIEFEGESIDDYL